MLSTRLLVNSRLLLIKFLESPKLQVDFWLCGSWVSLTRMLFKSQLYFSGRVLILMHSGMPKTDILPRTWLDSYVQSRAEQSIDKYSSLPSAFFSRSIPSPPYRSKACLVWKTWENTQKEWRIKVIATHYSIT